MESLLVFLAITGGFFAWLFSQYNQLQRLAQQVNGAEANARVALAKKLELLKPVQEAARDLMGVEADTHLKVSADMSGASLVAMGAQLTDLGNRMAVVSQLYPQLKGSDAHHRYITNIEGVEALIQDRRERYNAEVTLFNSTRAQIPYVFIARMIALPSAQFFAENAGVAVKVDEGERLMAAISTARGVAAQAVTSSASKIRELGESAIAATHRPSASQATDKEN